MGRTKFKTYQKIQASILYKPLKRFCLKLHIHSPRLKPWAMKCNEINSMDLSICIIFIKIETVGYKYETI